MASTHSVLYELKTYLFYNSNLDEFLLFIRNFKITIKASRTIAAGAKIYFLCMLVRGEELRQIDTFYLEVGSTTPKHLNSLFWV